MGEGILQRFIPKRGQPKSYILFSGTKKTTWTVPNRDERFVSGGAHYLDKLVEYEWIFEYSLDGFDEDGSDVEAGDLGLDGLHPSLEEPRDPRVRVVPLQKLLSLVVGHAVLGVR